MTTAPATARLTAVCPVCGAEQSLDTVLHGLQTDEHTRHLVADVVRTSVPLGADMLRYLRLHKPAKRALGLAKVRKVLGELVPAIVKQTVHRKGRDWLVTEPMWQAAFAAVFDAHQKGTLRTPLDGNAYLFEVALRQADKAEGQVEKAQEQTLRGREHRSDAPTTIAALATAALQKDPALLAIEASRANAKPPSAATLEKLNQLKKDLQK